jgi:hypothetical protein
MPDQPADPIHYDMKIPPEPDRPDEEREPAKRHGDKLDTETGTSHQNKPTEDEKRPA